MSHPPRSNEQVQQEAGAGVPDNGGKGQPRGWGIDSDSANHNDNDRETNKMTHLEQATGLRAAFVRKVRDDRRDVLGLQFRQDVFGEDGGSQARSGDGRDCVDEDAALLA